MKRDLTSADRFSQRRRRNQNRSTLAAISLIALLLLIFAGTRWYVDQGWALRATATMTATPRNATLTPTIDFRATQIAEDRALQQEYALIALGLDTPTPTITLTPTETPTPLDTPTETPTVEMTVVISMPSIVGGGPPASGLITTPTDIVPTVSPIETPTPINGDGNGGDQTATDEPSLAETQTPTATWTPVIAAQEDVLLQAFTIRAAPVREGPSTLYTLTTTIPAQQRLVLRGRDTSGEWIYVCCEQNVNGWIRQANLDLRDNQLPPSAPSNGTPNDARWLLEKQSTAIALTPIPAKTPIPAGDFPLYRRSSAGHAQVNNTFLSTLRDAWPQPAQAPLSLSSPVIVAGQSVIVASEDLELNSFDKNSGNQRWRHRFTHVIRHAVAVLQPFVYVVDTDGNLFSFIDQGNAISPYWQVKLPTQPRSAPNLYGNFLFIAGMDNRLYAINKDNGAVVWSIATPGSNLQYPIAGNQLLYAGNNSLQAVDIYNNGAVVWERSDIFSSVSAPPIYSQPGVLALAELYAANGNGNIYALDANTGKEIWTYSSNERVEMMALDRSNLYASGNNFIKAIARSNGALLWNYPVSGIVGGPIVGEGRLFFATESGTVQILDAFQGVLTTGFNVASVAGQPAAGDGMIFVPGRNGILYAQRETN
ncbi:MAG: PQQ-binding-like beta-propeller repeat protein [Caldilineaceae bacterium]|nr:PQQ-binding-like beta-propeller repeat protein [Caldilineaceae bacterium]